MSHNNNLGSLIDRWSERLLVDGYCVIPDLVPLAEVAALDADLTEDFEATPFCEGRFYGERTKRFGRLLARSPRAAPLVQHELVLGIVERVLSPWCDTFQLNLTQAIAVHPGALAQMPHRDQDMWRGAIGEVEYLVNVMWPFTRYTTENGATRVWPESHGHRALDPRPRRIGAGPRIWPWLSAPDARLHAPRSRRQSRLGGPPRHDRRLQPRMAQDL